MMRRGTGTSGFHTSSRTGGYLDVGGGPWTPFIISLLAREFKSKASGNFIAPGWYPSPTGPPPVLLEEGNVKVHQIAIYGYNLPLNNPGVYQFTSWSVPEGVLYDGGPLVQSPLLMPEMWPVEYVKLS